MALGVTLSRLASSLTLIPAASRVDLIVDAIFHAPFSDFSYSYISDIHDSKPWLFDVGKRAAFFRGGAARLWDRVPYPNRCRLRT
jgi:hypothetical protein